MTQPEPSPIEQTPRIVLVLSVLVAATAAITPLIITRDSFDVFRVAKDAVFLSMALLIAAALAAGALTSRTHEWLARVPRLPLILASAAVLWTAITAMTSERPIVSMQKPLTVFAMAVFFVAVMIAAQHGRQLLAIVIGLAPGLINAVIATLQSMNIWSPWYVELKADMERLRTTALLGNPNEVGTYFVVPAIAAFAAAIAWKRHRWWLGLLTLVLAAGVISSQSAAPLGATLIGLVAVALLAGTRRFRIVAVLIVLLFGGAAMLHPGTRGRLQTMAGSLREGALPELTSYRATPFVAALMMFGDHPLFGAGPGTFAALYMPYKERVDVARPQWIRMGSENYREVHNDHLQLLAETGLPGYALYVAALLLLARISMRRRDAADDARVRFARLFGMPAAIGFAVLTLAQFPLQLTAPMVTALYFAALAVTWQEAQ